MAIKKAYKELIEYLEANPDSKVKTILEGAKALCSAKSGGGKGGAQLFLKDAAGKVTHVFCYYHKKWEDVTKVEYGVKTTSPTGLNNMCKEGTSQWTKQFRAAKGASADLLDQVAEGKIKPSDIAGMKKDIEANRAKIVPREDGHGTKEAPGSEKTKAA